MNASSSSVRGSAAHRLLADLLPASRRDHGHAGETVPQPVWMARYLAREADSRLRILQRLHDGAAPDVTGIRDQMLADVRVWSESPAGRGPWPRSSAISRDDLLCFATELKQLDCTSEALQPVLQEVSDIVFSRARTLN